MVHFLKLSCISSIQQWALIGFWVSIYSVLYAAYLIGTYVTHVITEMTYLSTPRSSTLERFIITHIKEFLLCLPEIIKNRGKAQAGVKYKVKCFNWLYIRLWVNKHCGCSRNQFHPMHRGDMGQSKRWGQIDVDKECPWWAAALLVYTSVSPENKPTSPSMYLLLLRRTLLPPCAVKTPAHHFF